MHNESRSEWQGGDIQPDPPNPANPAVDPITLPATGAAQDFAFAIGTAIDVAIMDILTDLTEALSDEGYPDLALVFRDVLRRKRDVVQAAVDRRLDQER